MQVNHKRIYRLIIDEIERGTASRGEIIDNTVDKICNDTTCPSDRSRLRGEVGAVITEMQENGVVSVAKDNLVLNTTRPVALRAENCEREIINLLREGPLTRAAIRSRLERFFGTDRTATQKDDQTLYSLIGQVLKRLTTLGVITLSEGRYLIAPEKMASVDDISSILSLKADFITRLHSKGGEFFEHYIVTLLSKYLSKNGKTVTEAFTTGGAADGGIDGIIRTVDALGFREEIMIQAKNRNELVVETSVRGFYGAVCAAQGSRGIYATTSDFHPSASAFLESIDNCVGVNGEKIFEMAIECQYGIKKRHGKYCIDGKTL
ncbi:MAG: restriction endonuclease [Clostridia bacterium]|nr:restriction endonuclease [Clostridia bacterium]